MNKIILLVIILMCITHQAVAETPIDDNPWRAQENMRKAFIETLSKRFLLHCPARTKYGGSFICRPRGAEEMPSLIVDDQPFFTDKGWQEFSAFLTWFREHYAYHMQHPIRIHMVRGVFRDPPAAPGMILFNINSDGATVFETDMLLKYYDTHGDVACDAVDVKVVFRADKTHDFKIEHFNVAPSITNKLCDVRREPDLSRMGEEPQMLGDAPQPLQ